jgi:hypothetical protein
MAVAETPRALLVDPEGEADRTTASLISSLATRLVILHYTSGVSVVGSMLAGLTLAGREVAKTSEGARLKRRLESSPAFRNGETLWAALRIGDMAAGLPATPILDHVRNDLSLLLVDDLVEVLAQPPAPPALGSRLSAATAGEANFLDCLLGLWAHARETTRSIEGLASLAPTTPPVFEGGPVDGSAGTSLLR